MRESCSKETTLRVCAWNHLTLPHLAQGCVPGRGSQRRKAWWLLWFKAPETLMPGASPSHNQRLRASFPPRVLFLRSGERLADDARCTTCLLHAASLFPTKDTGRQGTQDMLRALSDHSTQTQLPPLAASHCAPPARAMCGLRNCDSLCLAPFQYSG